MGPETFSNPLKPSQSLGGTRRGGMLAEVQGERPETFSNLLSMSRMSKNCRVLVHITDWT